MDGSYSRRPSVWVEPASVSPWILLVIAIPIACIVHIFFETTFRDVYTYSEQWHWQDCWGYCKSNEEAALQCYECERCSTTNENSTIGNLTDCQSKSQTKDPVCAKIAGILDGEEIVHRSCTPTSTAIGWGQIGDCVEKDQVIGGSTFKGTICLCDTDGCNVAVPSLSSSFRWIIATLQLVFFISF